MQKVAPKQHQSKSIASVCAMLLYCNDRYIILSKANNLFDRLSYKFIDGLSQLFDGIHVVVFNRIDDAGRKMFF